MGDGFYTAAIHSCNLPALTSQAYVIVITSHNSSANR